jgi:hypothetical protein
MPADPIHVTVTFKFTLRRSEGGYRRLVFGANCSGCHRSFEAKTSKLRQRIIRAHPLGNAMVTKKARNSGLKERVTQLERRPEPRHEPRRIAVGEYLGLEVRVLNEERGISEILFANGNRTHVESSMVKRGGGSLLSGLDRNQRSAG